MLRLEQALSRPSECSIQKYYNQSWPRLVMPRLKNNHSWPKMVMPRSKNNHSWPKNVMPRPKNNQSWPKLVILRLEQALSRPSECSIQVSHTQSWPKKGMLRSKDDQSWPKMVMLRLEQALSRPIACFITKRKAQHRVCYAFYYIKGYSEKGLILLCLDVEWSSYIRERQSYSFFRSFPTMDFIFSRLPLEGVDSCS